MERPRSLLLTCRRCGTEIRQESTGRRRQFCGAACRQAGKRLRALHGGDWWHRQPWYPAWRDAQDEWSALQQEERGRVANEARNQIQRERELLDAMPPDVRAGAERARLARMKGQTRQIQRACLALEVGSLSLKYRDALAGEGVAIQVAPVMQGKVGRLLWSAASTDSEHEAAAMLAKARALVASGEADGSPLAQVSGDELLRRFLGSSASRH